MKKQFNKKIFTKEWIELTLCDMVDEILSKNKDKDSTMKIIRKYSAQIYNSQNDYDKR